MGDRLSCCPLSRNLFRLALIAVVAAGSFLTVRAIADKQDKPANAIVLFDGKDLSKWRMQDGSEPKWKLVDDGAMEVGGGNPYTKESFAGDFILHLEFMPNDVGPGPTGQARGNSGVYLQDNYEIQVLDSYGVKKLAPGDCAGIYSKKPPDKNAAKPPGQWQTFHIKFTAPKFDAAGKKTSNARITLDWNGERVHDDVEINGPTPGGSGERPEAGPIWLQDHGNPVRYRNIWIAPIEKKL